MSRLTGRSKNTNDTAVVVAGITLNSSTTVVIAAANPDRLFFHVHSNFPEKACWIKLQAASVDNVQKGIFLNEKEKGETSWEMPPDNVYTGEISAIADDGAPMVYVTEY